MNVLIRYDLATTFPAEETVSADDVIRLVKEVDWENELRASDTQGSISSLDILDLENERILTLSVMEQKEDLLFTVESLRTGKKQRGKAGTLINDLPYPTCVEVVTRFCSGEYASIDALDNSGLISKFLRKLTYSFVGEDWHT